MGKVVQLDAQGTSATKGAAAGVPPLSQSRQGTMGCATLYRHLYITGGDQTVSEYADRGRAVHAAIARYIRHLVETGRKTDRDMLDGLIATSSEEVAGILENFRDVQVFEPQQLYDAELYIALDEHNFPILECASCRQPRRRQELEDGTIVMWCAACKEEQVVAREGTLDLVQLPTSSTAIIDDWKTYYQIVDADTFQSKLYPFLLMCLNPALQSVTFRLRFVRYGDALREVTYTREEMPKLRKLVDAERARQLELHERPPVDAAFEARPGRQCTYCPLLNNGCPIASVNPYRVKTAAERVALELYFQEARKENLRVLRDQIVEHGPVSYRDDVGTEYVARFEPQERRTRPLGTTLPVLTEWTREHPSDGAFVEGLTIGGFKSTLKAKKRMELAARLEAVSDVRVLTKLKVGRPGETEADDEE